METFLGILILALGMILGFMMAVALYAFEYILDRRHSVKMPRKFLERTLRDTPVFGAKGTGGVLMPESEEEIGRRMIIEENRLKGRETKLSEL